MKPQTASHHASRCLLPNRGAARILEALRTTEESVISIPSGELDETNRMRGHSVAVTGNSVCGTGRRRAVHIGIVEGRWPGHGYAGKDDVRTDRDRP